MFNHGEDDLESGTREDDVTRDEEDKMVRRLPVDDRRGGAPKRATVLFVASIGTPLAGLVAVLTLGGSDALPLVLAGVAALALLTAWVTSGMSDDDAEPSSSSRPHPDTAGPTRRDDHEE